jgi:hypothetical protein
VCRWDVGAVVELVAAIEIETDRYVVERAGAWLRVKRSLPKFCNKEPLGAFVDLRREESLAQMYPLD